MSLNPFILALWAAVAAKSVIPGIWVLTPITLVLRVVLVAMLLIAGILSSVSLIFALYASFFTTSLSLLKSTKTGINLSTSDLCTSD